MHRLSRREFLKFAGIALLGSQLDHFLPEQDQPTRATHGRAFAAATIHNYPATNSPIHVRLWPDSLTPLIDTQGDWYRTPQGYVRCADVQPVLLYPAQGSGTPPTLPFWAEVTSPVAVVRTWSDAAAPLATRIGHGGTLHVIDYLPVSHDLAAWYGVAATDGTLLGWTPAIHWQPVEDMRKNSHPVQLQIEHETQRVVVFAGERPILRAPAAIGMDLEVGTYLALQHEIGGVSHAGFHGASWPLYFGAHNSPLTGVYWHNQFGQSIPGTGVQVTPLLARWLYQQGVNSIRVL